MLTTTIRDARTDRFSAPRNLPQPDNAVTRPSEILFIDPAVSDIDVLLSGVRPGVEAIVLDAERPAAGQLAVALAERRGLDAVHIIAHGAPGRVHFASGDWSAATLAEQAGDLAVIGEALGKCGGLRLWSCYTAAGTTGRSFIHGLAEATGTDVAASIHRVGAAALHGVWALATCTGVAPAKPPLTASGAATYAGVLDVDDYIEVSGSLPSAETEYVVVVNNVVVGQFTLSPAFGPITTFDINVEVSSAGPAQANRVKKSCCDKAREEFIIPSCDLTSDTE